MLLLPVPACRYPSSIIWHGSPVGIRTIYGAGMQQGGMPAVVHGRTHIANEKHVHMIEEPY